MLDMLKQRLGIEDGSQDGLLSSLLSDAEWDVLNYTRRAEMIPPLETYVVRLAVIAYQKQGAEGESGHIEGGISRSYVDGIPNEIKCQLNRYIKAKVIR